MGVDLTWMTFRVSFVASEAFARNQRVFRVTNKVSRAYLSVWLLKFYANAEPSMQPIEQHALEYETLRTCRFFHEAKEI